MAPSTLGELPHSVEFDADLTYRSRRTSNDASQNPSVSLGEPHTSIAEELVADSSLSAYAQDPAKNGMGISPNSGPFQMRSPISTNKNSTRVVSPSNESYTGRGPSLYDTELWRWSAFIHKHRKLMTVLNEATQLRRLCIERRRNSDSVSTQLTEEGLQAMPVDTRSSTGESSGESPVDAPTLHEIEMRLDQLDEQLIRDASDLLQATPRVLNMMQTRLPTLLAKHLLDFRGDSGADSESVAFSEQEQDLDPVAAEILRKQGEMDSLEDEILRLQATRTRKEDECELPGNEDQEFQSQAQEFLKDLDHKITEAVAELKTMRAELERSRDMPEKSDPDGTTQIPEPVPPHAIPTAGASHLRNSYNPG